MQMEAMLLNGEDGMDEDKRKILSHWQRPVDLCKELLSRFLVPGSHVLDINPHCGSLLMASYDLELSVDAVEQSSDFFIPAEQRLIDYVASKRPVEKQSIILGRPRMQLSRQPALR